MLYFDIEMYIMPIARGQFFKTVYHAHGKSLRLGAKLVLEPLLRRRQLAPRRKFAPAYDVLKN
jgi:hypothetical protein